jgi:hypothetical protein
MGHFYRKRWFAKPDIFQNVHLRFSSNFGKINFNIWTTSSTRNFASFRNGREKCCFGHNSVNIKYFYVLSFATFKSSYTTNFIEGNIFIRHKMALEIQNGGLTAMGFDFFQ